jgi:hypothetical protein
MRWAENEVCMGDKRVLELKPEKRHHLEDPGIDGRLILK